MPRELQAGHRPSSLSSIHPIRHGHCHRGSLTPGAVLRATSWPLADPQKLPLRAYSLTQYCPAVSSLSHVHCPLSLFLPVSLLSPVSCVPWPHYPVFSLPHNILNVPCSLPSVLVVPSVLTPHCVLAVPCSCSHTILTVQSSLFPESLLSKVSSVSP